MAYLGVISGDLPLPGRITMGRPSAWGLHRTLMGKEIDDNAERRADKIQQSMVLLPQ